MSRDNLELVERLAAAFSDADFETVFAGMDPAIRLYPRPEEPGVDDVYTGHEGVLAWAVNWYGQWEEYEAVAVRFVDAPGNRVLVVFAERGRMERTGITIEQEFSHSFAVRDGRVVEWRQYDSYEQALEALGLLEMSQADIDAPPSLERFRRAYLVANEAFNSHDFDAAFFGFHPDLEWHTVAEVPGPRVIRGRHAVVEAFRGLLGEFPDWRVEPQEFIEAEHAILVRNMGTASGRESGVPVRQPFTQVWTFREGRPVRVREYLDHSEALEAAGLPSE